METMALLYFQALGVHFPQDLNSVGVRTKMSSSRLRPGLEFCGAREAEPQGGERVGDGD